jgi:hypothetical protein
MPFLFVYIVCLCHHYSNVYHATHLTIFVYVNYKLCIVIILKFDYFTIHYILITKAVNKNDKRTQEFNGNEIMDNNPRKYL